jgi:hypothetical protein
MAGGLVSAATIVETFTFTPTSGTPNTTNYAGTLTAAGFAGLGTFGTLTDVSVFLQSAIQTQITATASDTGTVQNGSVNSVAGLAVDDQAVTFTSGTNTYSSAGDFSSTVGIPELGFTSPTFVFNVGGGTGTVGTGSNGCAVGLDCVTSSLFTHTTNDTIDATGTPAAFLLSLFNVSGDVNLFADAGAVTTSINGGSNATISQNTTEALTATVTFTYTPPQSGTPEPATLFLMGSALVGVGLLRKRIKA